MNNTGKIYTYRVGQKVELEKNPEIMMVGEVNDNLYDPVVVLSTRVSFTSTHIKTSKAELATSMKRCRRVSPTHHAYYETECGAELLSTDRICIALENLQSDGKTDVSADSFGSTSSAIPFVEGVAALTISENPKLSALEVISKQITRASYLRKEQGRISKITEIRI